MNEVMLRGEIANHPRRLGGRILFRLDTKETESQRIPCVKKDLNFNYKLNKEDEVIIEGRLKVDQASRLFVDIISIDIRD